MEGKKFDDGKQDWSLVDLSMIEPLIAAMVNGEAKYGFDDWKAPIDGWDRRYYSAMIRHAKASQHNALAFNKEDECYHLAQVAINALFRLYHAQNEELKHPVYDDTMTMALEDWYDLFKGTKNLSVEKED